MTHTPTNDNTPRPAEFDARLLAYRPRMRKLAARLVDGQHREDLVSDTIIYSLEHWKSFREDGGFCTWVRWNMRGVLSNQRQAAAVREHIALVEDDDAYHNAATPATQADYADLSSVLGRVSNNRNGRVLLRRAMGDRMKEIGGDLGLTRQRVEQILREERNRLRKAVG